MKKIGIIGAMEEEIKRLKDKMEKVKISNIAAMDFYEGNLNNASVVVVRSGIGKVNAAICTQILVDRFGIDLVINTGVAGSLRNEIDIADIVLSTDALQHDMDATGFGYKVGEIPQMKKSVFEADKYLIDLAEKVCKENLPNVGVHKGRIVSGDQFISDADKKEWLLKTFDGYCTEMEGAAIAQAAYLNNIPFLIIRAISDKADHSAEMAFNEFEAIAIDNSVKLLTELIKRID
ncbi:adenosylhomocysteine nucleosidase [Herbinix hemicellulosilytica]|uniref:adenosylhomocysteine nucleosidase n=1 Tax=Herbinix hemicellulosilytica TaxID=1564487 RepID=A0A0H5SKV7_HERHM|nr:5'-methylthioadenosine/adenosylhomocysteine nucleosidase [Herbinix hemicellulosilytica]RBP57907.1 adenosylhomocysteine nucleosidase [Herbinix hemicellulosilytica]CRZ35755.1 5'-methylthioadenosine/S-adenosylhomocysteinenucleosidase [Herbinix hemicellulosilytica]